MDKNTFILQTKLEAPVSKLSDKQAGVLFKSILKYAKNGTVATFEDSAVDITFEIVRQDIDYTSAKYADVCRKRKEAIEKRWANKQKNRKNTKVYKCIQNDTNAYKRIHNDNDVDNDNDMSCYDINKQQLLTAPKAAETPQNKPKQLNQLQLFAEEVIKNFEPDVQTKDQKSIWYKRNCRCLSDIFRFCGKNIPLALKTIDTCLERMAKAGYSCGYEAVCRNLPEYMAVAKQKMEGTYAATR